MGSFSKVKCWCILDGMNLDFDMPLINLIIDRDNNRLVWVKHVECRWLIYCQRKLKAHPTWHDMMFFVIECVGDIINPSKGIEIEIQIDRWPSESEFISALGLSCTKKVLLFNYHVTAPLLTQIHRILGVVVIAIPSTNVPAFKPNSSCLEYLMKQGGVWQK